MVSPDRATADPPRERFLVCVSRARGAHQGCGRRFLVNNRESASRIPPIEPHRRGDNVSPHHNLSVIDAPSRISLRSIRATTAGARHGALMQTPDAVGAGRNSDCGFSPSRFSAGWQKIGCQDSCLKAREKFQRMHQDMDVRLRRMTARGGRHSSGSVVNRSG